MKQSNDPWFHRGKEARANNKPCIIPDGRLKGSSRQAFFDGYAYQDNLLKPPPSAEELAQNETFFADLRAKLRGAKP